MYVLMYPGEVRTYAHTHTHTHATPHTQNKLIYTEIFAKYTELIEGYLESRLKQNISTFSMPDFMEMLMYSLFFLACMQMHA